MEPHIFMAHDIYTEYRGYSKIPEQYRIKGRENLRAFLKVIFKHIALTLVKNTSGVMIKNLGYLFIWKIPRKMKYRQYTKNKGVKESYNYHTNHHRFTPVFMPVKTRNRLLDKWSLDNSFTDEVKQGIKEHLLAGKKYYAYPYSITYFNKMQHE